MLNCCATINCACTLVWQLLLLYLELIFPAAHYCLDRYDEGVMKPNHYYIQCNHKLYWKLINNRCSAVAWERCRLSHLHCCTPTLGKTKKQKSVSVFSLNLLLAFSMMLHFIKTISQTIEQFDKQFGDRRKLATVSCLQSVTELCKSLCALHLNFL